MTVLLKYAQGQAADDPQPVPGQDALVPIPGIIEEYADIVSNLGVSREHADGLPTGLDDVAVAVSDHMDNVNEIAASQVSSSTSAS